MTKFIKGDRIWVLAEVSDEKYDENTVSVRVFAPCGEPSTTVLFADAKKSRMETPIIEVGDWVNMGMKVGKVIAVAGSYYWVEDGHGIKSTVHISSITSRRDGPRSFAPAGEE